MSGFRRTWQRSHEPSGCCLRARWSTCKSCRSWDCRFCHLPTCCPFLSGLSGCWCPPACDSAASCRDCGRRADHRLSLARRFCRSACHHFGKSQPETLRLLLPTCRQRFERNRLQMITFFIFVYFDGAKIRISGNNTKQFHIFLPKGVKSEKKLLSLQR